jgi:hypothetical protein
MKFTLKTPATFFESPDKLRKFLNRQGAFLTDQIKKKILLAPPRTGKRYRRGGNAIHVASAPGEPPAIDSGNLVNSFQYQVQSESSLLLSSSRDYAEELEFEKNRPYFIETIQNNLDNLLDNLKKL